MKSQNNNLNYSKLTLILLLIIFLGFLPIRTLLHNNNVRNDKLKIIQQRENQLTELERKSENKIINKSCRLFDKNGSELKLEEIISGKHLIYKFTENSCWSCVEKDLKIIKQLSKGNNNINAIIITNYNNLRTFKVIASQLDINIPFYNIQNRLGLSIELDKDEIPFYFITNVNFKAELIRASRPELKENNSYFRSVLEHFNS